MDHLMRPGVIWTNSETVGRQKENEIVGKFLFGSVINIHVQREKIDVFDNCTGAYQQSKCF